MTFQSVFQESPDPRWQRRCEFRFTCSASPRYAPC